MPQLKNVKYETFCQHIATSPKTRLSQGECYTKAGFKTDGRSADACAARLLTVANVQARIAELMQPAAKKVQASLESLLDRLETNIEAAAASGQHGAVNGSLRLMAELRGMLIQRTEVGAPGDFAGIETVADVAGAMLREMDAATALSTLSDLMKLIEAQAGQAAVEVPHYRRQNETQLALRALRR
jgi:hypothetical protein